MRELIGIIKGLVGNLEMKTSKEKQRIMLVNYYLAYNI